jgi:FkbM family methyltransferase
VKRFADRIAGGDRWEIACFYQTEVEVQVLEMLLKDYEGMPGPVVLDVGANIGQYSYYLSRYVAPHGGKCVGFEPRSDIWSRLRRNVGQPNFTAERLALSDREGMALLSLPESHWFSSLVEGQPRGIPCERVRTTTLDTYVRERDLGPVTLLKVDVEGHEPEVLRGARCLLERQAPVVLCELENRHLVPRGEAVHQVVGYMRSLGYACFVMSHEQLALLPVDRVAIPDDKSGPEEYYYNYWFVHERVGETVATVRRILQGFRRARRPRDASMSRENI